MTCYLPNHPHPTRRDFAFVSVDFVLFVSNFRVAPPSEIPVHGYLAFDVSFPCHNLTKQVLLAPSSFSQPFDNIIRHKHSISEHNNIPPDIYQLELAVVHEHVHHHITDLTHITSIDALWRAWCVQ
eukprot:5836310-Karenia_brevis.AAC.1